MTQTEKLIRILFVSNILYILAFFLLAFEPKFVLDSIQPDGMSLFEGVLYILAILSFIHWIYCLWFLNKYDRHSGDLIWLILLNGIYAPYYYYQVHIQKRPLKGEITETHTNESEDISISDTEFIELTRRNIFDIVDLWASKENQLDYQKNVPKAQVSAELFCQWEDFYFPDSNDFKQAFEKEEWEILSDFDKALNDTVQNTPHDLPLIEEFVKTKEWIEMNKKAIEIKKELNKAEIIRNLESEQENYTNSKGQACAD